MATNNPGRILVAPLDWGLGHTTRCIPLIGWLLRLGHHVVFAGNQWQHRFIDNIFPAIEKIHLDGYNVTYGSRQGLEQFALFAQLPRLRKTIKREHEWLQQHAAGLRLDGIISDNRYGLYHPNLPSVIITHQLQVQSGMGSTVNRAVQQVHYKFLERFGNIWVPDVEGPQNLGGALSHTRPRPHNTSYLGLLSQFDEEELPPAAGQHLLVLLSGPEPQRTILAGILWQQVQSCSEQVVFVEGTDSAVQPTHIPDHIIWHRRISGPVLTAALQHAAIVVCRSGYSTLMDLVRLSKKAILIPTPGQTEQEYLGRHLQEQGIFLCRRQKGLDLAEALVAARGFPFAFPALQQYYTGYQGVITKWIDDRGQ